MNVHDTAVSRSHHNSLIATRRPTIETCLPSWLPCLPQFHDTTSFLFFLLARYRNGFIHNRTTRTWQTTTGRVSLARVVDHFVCRLRPLSTIHWYQLEQSGTNPPTESRHTRTTSISACPCREPPAHLATAPRDALVRPHTVAHWSKASSCSAQGILYQRVLLELTIGRS
jgi:hypothetical protein